MPGTHPHLHENTWDRLTRSRQASVKLPTKSPERRKTLGAKKLEPHRRSEPEPAVTLRPEADAELADWDFFPDIRTGACAHNGSKSGSWHSEYDSDDDPLIASSDWKCSAAR